MEQVKKQTKEDFCRNSFKWGGIDIKWFDLTGMSPIDHERHAKIEMRHLHTQGHYVRFEVSIINKMSGCIDKKTFLFSDYLGPEDNETGIWTFAAVNYGGMYWWETGENAAPKSTRRICVAIENYIATFR
ncbi:unnamed protein product [marine sediment metagenome]|uniref:Uncharacterized protein n=1 Tax=marine sediment metagenome TaxID=412755 RepID=X1F9E3_9ZZZZ